MSEGTGSYTGTSRPPHIASKSWQKLQYPERLELAAAERAKVMVEAENRAASRDDEAAVDPLVPTEPAESSSDQQGVVRDDVAGSVSDRDDTSVGAGSASTARPVIVEYGCAPVSKSG